MEVSRELLTEIKYIGEGIGYIPLLKGQVTHGFSWGKDMGNMSFAWEDDSDLVAKRVIGFLERLAMDPIEGTVNMVAEHGTRIIDVTEETFDAVTINQFGAQIPCDAFFTLMDDLPLVVKPADCTVSIVSAKTGGGGRVLGMIHAGRLGLDYQLPTLAIRHLLEKYEVDPTEVFVGTVPTITSRRYYLRDFGELLRPDGWEGFVDKRDGFFYLDFTGYLIKQLIQSGIPRTNIQAYDVDTYEAATNGESFSHRYWREKDQKIPNGRMIVAAKI